MNTNEVFGERETGCFVLLKQYLGGYGGNGVPGSGSWAADYYMGPYTDWQHILSLGQTNFIKRIMISENELAYYYERLGYLGIPNQPANSPRYRFRQT